MKYHQRLFFVTCILCLIAVCLVATASASGSDSDHHSDEDHDHSNHTDSDDHDHSDHSDEHHSDHSDHDHSDHSDEHHSDEDHDHSDHDHSDHSDEHHSDEDHDHSDHDHSDEHGSNHTDSDDHDHDDHDDHDHDAHAHDSHDEDSKLVDGLKGMSLGVIGGIAIIVDVVVVAFPQLRTKPVLISILSSFAAGIFIVIGLSHLLAEGVDIIALHTNQGDNERFRPAYMVAIAGYYFMVILQRGVLKLDEKLVKECMYEGTTKQPVAASPAAAVTSSKDADVNSTGGEPEPQEEVDYSPETDPKDSAPEPYASEDGDAAEKSTVIDVDGVIVSSSADKKNEEHDCDSDPVMQRRHQLNLIVLFIMFYIHGLTEGIALGLQQTTNGVLLVFIAIVAHHWAADLIFTFATGRVHALSGCARLALAITLSMNTPVGIAIGWVLAETIPSLATGYILSFCAGSFLMIAMTEIIAEEMPMGKRNLPQFAASALGVCLMYGALAGMYSPEAHAH